jgi:tryptophanyl-tRNA synthetase
VTTNRTRILSGIQPSGTLHLGNYFGMMRPALELQDSGHECFYFIADYHALTTLPDPKELRERIRGVAVDFLACGLDPARTVLFRQSDVPQVQELTWVLSCLTPVGLLERCHSFKDKTARGIAANHGLFSYPVLMAADILIYRSNGVPVGKDQKQHLEVTRDLAIRFNNQYGEILTVPEALIREEVAVVPGTDGQKMSKSYGNTIEIFADEKPVRQKIMRIVTDSTPVEQPKDPARCSVFALARLLLNPDAAEALRQRYLAGGMGYGEAKKTLFEAYWEYFRPFRERRAALIADPGYVDGVLRAGGERARAVAEATLAAVKQAIGLA